MAIKSLYTILGVHPDASADEIEKAYAETLHRLQDGTDVTPGGDNHIRLVAAKEAYTVLSNPTSRQLYDQKLFAPQTVGRAQEEDTPRAHNWGLAKLLAAGAIVIAAVWVYSYSAVEKERLRIEHEKQMVEAQLKLEQELIEQQETLQQTMFARRAAMEQEARERSLREQALRESRELDYRLQQQARQQTRDKEAQKQKEISEQMRVAREKLYRDQQEADRQRQQKLEAERQMEREWRAIRELKNL